MRYFKLLHHRERSEAISPTVGEIASAEKLPRNDVRLVFISLMLFVSIFLSTCTATNDGPTTFVASENLDEMFIPALDVDEPELPGALTGEFSIYSEKPVFYRGTNDAWDDTFVLPDAVVFNRGLYHMFYTGYSQLSGAGGIGYAVSSNGYDWYRLANTPILNWNDTVGSSLWLRASSVLIDNAGTWTLYLTTYRREITEEKPAIYRATSESANGPWTFDDVPLLEGGDAGAWDSSGVGTPVVIHYEGRYLMYYSNVRQDNQRGFSAIGMATSNDGFVWEKYNDPATEEKFEESDPVFRLPEDSLASEFIGVSSVWQSFTGINMTYISGRASDNRFGFAFSSDGVVWNELNESLSVSEEDIPFLEYISSPKILYRNNQYFLFFRGSADANQLMNSDIYLLTVTE